MIAFLILLRSLLWRYPCASFLPAADCKSQDGCHQNSVDDSALRILVSLVAASIIQLLREAVRDCQSAVVGQRSTEWDSSAVQIFFHVGPLVWLVRGKLCMLLFANGQSDLQLHHESMICPAFSTSHNSCLQDVSNVTRSGANVVQ